MLATHIQPLSSTRYVEFPGCHILESVPEELVIILISATGIQFQGVMYQRTRVNEKGTRQRCQGLEIPFYIDRHLSISIHLSEKLVLYLPQLVGFDKFIERCYFLDDLILLLLAMFGNIVTKLPYQSSPPWI